MIKFPVVIEIYREVSCVLALTIIVLRIKTENYVSYQARLGVIFSE